jgi:hypothetical protein
MKCEECTHLKGCNDDKRPEWCKPNLESNTMDDDCNDFSIRCVLCNTGHVEAEGCCCEDLVLAREEDSHPCPGKPDGSEACKGCPGIEDPPKEQVYVNMKRVLR